MQAISPSPSFSAHSSPTLADTASRVIDQLKNDPHPDWIELDPQNDPNPDWIEQEQEQFEFAFVTAEPNCSPISADQIFHNGRIKPVYPNFNPRPKTTPSGRVSLRRLMIMEDRRDATTPTKTPDSKRWRLRDSFVFVPHSVKTTGEGAPRRSFHGQRQDLMGILANVNGLNRKLRPF